MTMSRRKKKSGNKNPFECRRCIRFPVDSDLLRVCTGGSLQEGKQSILVVHRLRAPLVMVWQPLKISTACHIPSETSSSSSPRQRNYNIGQLSGQEQREQQDSSSLFLDLGIIHHRCRRPRIYSSSRCTQSVYYITDRCRAAASNIAPRETWRNISQEEVKELHVGRLVQRPMRPVDFWLIIKSWKRSGDAAY